MNIRLLRTCLVATAGIFIITGCGGGGLLGASGATMSLSANRVEVAYGEQVTISWNSNEMSHVRETLSNFVVDSTDTSGSLVDTPSANTTYKLVMEDETGHTHERTVTVNVTKSTKKIILVADSAVAGVLQLKEFLEGITATPVTISTGLPSLSGVNVVVLLESASVGTGQHSAIQSYLAGGGSVVLVGRGAPKLATGNATNPDLSSIGSWFAGVTNATIGYYDVVSSSPVGLPLSSVILGDSFYGVGVYPVSGSAYHLTPTSVSSSAGFAYKPGSGGKVGYIADAPIGSTSEAISVRYLFLTICRWAADGS